MKTESGSLERVSGQIRLHVFLGYPFVFGVLRLRGENRAGERERQQNYGKPERFPSSALINTGLQRNGLLSAGKPLKGLVLVGRCCTPS